MAKKGVRQEASGTAGGTAFLRALACVEYPGEPIGADDMAGLFLSWFQRLLIKGAKRNSQRIKSRIPRGLYEYLMARTAFFDGLFLEFLYKETPQIVLMGAGYDTRPYRFRSSNKGTTVFELDMATTQARKRKCLAKGKRKVPEQVRFVPIDFNRESISSVLEAAGYRPDKETLFVFEGVSYYLTREGVDAVLEVAANNSRSKSLIAFDYRASIPLQEIGNCYGAVELIQSMGSRHPHEKGLSSIEDGKIKDYLKQRNLKLAEHLDNEQMENAFLKDARGALRGRVTGWFRFATASPAGKGA